MPGQVRPAPENLHIFASVGEAVMNKLPALEQSLLSVMTLAEQWVAGVLELEETLIADSRSAPEIGPDCGVLLFTDGSIGVQQPRVRVCIAASFGQVKVNRVFLREIYISH